MRRPWSMPAKTTVYRVTDELHAIGARPRVVLETDDWVDALAAANTRNWPRDTRSRSVEGTHPSHEWGPPHPGQNPPHYRRCTECGGWDNGSYGSQMPCEYPYKDLALVTIIERELGMREAARILARGVTHIGTVDLEEITRLMTPEET